VTKRKKIKRFKKHLEEVNSQSMDLTTMFGYKYCVDVQRDSPSFVSYLHISDFFFNASSNTDIVEG
jgi:hypothetical protein